MKQAPLLAVAVLLLAGAAALLPGLLFPEREFEGTDDLAAEAAEALAPGFEPWANLPGTGPASEESEDRRFVLQGAVGGGLFLLFVVLLARRSPARGSTSTREPGSPPAAPSGAS